MMPPPAFWTDELPKWATSHGYDMTAALGDLREEHSSAMKSNQTSFYHKLDAPVGSKIKQTNVN